jgi:hypothetical protein
MERNELAQSLIDREALAKIGFKDAEAAKAKYDLLRQTMTADEAAKALGDEQLAKQYEQQSIQEKFNDSMEQLKIMLSDSLLPGFEKMGEFLTKNMGVIKTMVGLFIALKAAQVTYNALSVISLAIQKKRKKEATQEALADITGGAFKSLGVIPVVGAIAAGILAAGTIASMFSDIGKMDDGIDGPLTGGTPGYSRTMYGPEGAISFNDKDTIVAGTDLIGGKKQTTRGGSGGVDMSSVVNAISGLQRDINTLANRPINVSMDGKKVIEATTGNQPNTQGDESRKNSYRIS